MILFSWMQPRASISIFCRRCSGFWLPGGILLSDNVLQDGDIIESRFAVERRDRTIHSRMREYLYTLTHHPDLTTSVLPLGDGVTLSVKRSSSYE